METNIVKCEICGIEMKFRINGSHLKRLHNMTLSEYKSKFPNSKIGKIKLSSKSYMCKICDENKNSSSALSKHVNLLLKSYNEIDIITDRKIIPKIKYTDLDGKYRMYCADIWIPKDNILVEIKSKYTYDLHAQNVYHKQMGVISSGYKFKLFVFNDNGTLNNINNDK